jgi:hypothetical protein
MLRFVRSRTYSDADTLTKRSRTVQKLACAELSGGAVIVIKHSAEAASASNESVVVGETAIGNDE